MFVIPLARHPAHHAAHSLSRHIERLFDLERQDEALALRSPALDISETDGAYTLTLDLPGVAKEAVKIRIEGRRVSIDAEQAREAASADGERSLYRERALTRFSRSISLPKEVTQAESSAKLDKGVLTLSLVKRQAEGSGELRVA